MGKERRRRGGCYKSVGMMVYRVFVFFVCCKSCLRWFFEKTGAKQLAKASRRASKSCAKHYTQRVRDGRTSSQGVYMYMYNGTIRTRVLFWACVHLQPPPTEGRS